MCMYVIRHLNLHPGVEDGSKGSVVRRWKKDEIKKCHLHRFAGFRFPVTEEISNYWPVTIMQNHVKLKVSNQWNGIGRTKILGLRRIPMNFLKQVLKIVMENVRCEIYVCRNKWKSNLENHLYCYRATITVSIVALLWERALDMLYPETTQCCDHGKHSFPLHIHQINIYLLAIFQAT